MTLVALDGTPLVMVGAANRQGTPAAVSASSILTDAANEAAILIGHIFTEDGGSHTIDTTGSSSLGWLTSAVTFANAGTTVKVGLAALDTATGPAGRAAAVANVITFDVSKSLTGGGGGITANGWQEHVPDSGSKTVANGDAIAFAVQMTAAAGVDAVSVAAGPGSLAGMARPNTTSYTGGSYANFGGLPNAVITFSDGVRGYFYGGSVAASVTTQTWNSGSATKEYGNFLQLPVPTKIYGIAAGINIGGDVDLVLYSDPLGTPVAQATASIDANTIGAASANNFAAGLFATPYSATANQPLAAIAKPGATNIGMNYKSFSISAHQKSENLGANGYAINRSSGAFAAQNSNKDRFAIGLLVGAFDSGAGGYPASRVQLGM